MNKQILKSQIKKYLPEIIFGTISVASIAGLVYLVKKLDDDTLIVLSDADWAEIASGSAAKIRTGSGDVYVAKEYPRV